MERTRRTMASSSSFTTEHLPPTRSDTASLLEQAWDLLTRPVTMLAFWLAVLLPLVHVALLISGLNSTGDYLMLGGSLMMNVGALFLGHGYGQE